MKLIACQAVCPTDGRCEAQRRRSGRLAWRFVGAEILGIFACYNNIQHDHTGIQRIYGLGEAD